MSPRSILLAATTLMSLALPIAAIAADAPAFGTYGFDTKGMDPTVDAADDFYGHANGGWDKATTIPADRSNFGMFTALDDLSRQRTREIVEAAAKVPGDKVGDLYTSFMDEAAANSKGLAPFQPWMKQIKAVKSGKQLARIMAGLQADGFAAGPFASYVSQDEKNPERYIVSLVQYGLGLPDREYYLKDDPALAKARTAYEAYLAQLLTLAGEQQAAARAKAILAFETELARNHWSRVDSRDSDKAYNIWSKSDFAQKAPGFDWTAYFGALGVSAQPQINLNQPSAISAGAKLFSTAPIATVRDYLLVHALNIAAPYLGKDLETAAFDFNQKTLNGTPEIEPRWKRGVDFVKGGMGEAVGKAYVAKYFPPEAKTEMDVLVKNIIAAMDRRLAGLDWMTQETKVQARAKLAAFTPKIGYPDRWRDYSALKVSRDDMFGNIVRVSRFEHDRQISKLGKPIDRGEWFMTPMEVNAYANPVMNEIVFPAAILQPPFFDPKADPALNYGAIGAVIGHEISHHFDDQGRKYDKNGALTDWWTKEDVTRFTALTDKLVAQYDAYEPLPGEKVNGKLTLGENIADLAGLTVAYEAWKLSLGGKDAPVVDGTNGEQRFYYGWAQIWRRKYREANLRQRLHTDPHSPSVQRAWVVRNLDPWYAGFAPKPDAKMYLPPEKRVKIW